MFKFFKKNNVAVEELEKRVKNLESTVLQLTKQNLGLTKSLINLQECIDEFTRANCIAKGGRVVNTAKGETCRNDEVNAGDIDDLSCSCICCIMGS